jgi:hypothetical protein
MKTWLRWAFYFTDGKYAYGKWNQPDDERARDLQKKPNIDRVEIHGKMLSEDQRTEVLASLSGDKYKKLIFDMSQVFVPSYGMKLPVMKGIRLMDIDGNEKQVMGE